MKPVNSLQRSLLQAVRLLTVAALILSLGVAGSVHAAGPDLTIQVSNSGGFIEGGTGSTYTVTVSNVGDTPTSGLVTMDFNLNATYFTATAINGAGWNCDLGTLTCTRSDALSGGGFSYPAITITVDVANDTPETVDNDASISGGGDVNGDNNVDFDTTNVEQVADLTIEKTHSPVEFVQGEQGAYTITVTNDGDGPTTGLVTVTEILPEGLTAVSFGGTGWSCSLATLICTRSDALAAGASYPAITLTVSVNLSANDPEINEVFVDGGGELNTANNNSVDVTDIKLQPDVRIVAYELLDANDDPLVGNPQAGDNFKVKLSVQNQGGADTPGVFYRSVYVDGLGDYLPGDPSDDIDYEFFSELEISTKPSYEHAGCLYYGDPEQFISKGTFYTSQNFLSLPAGVTDSQNSVIEISGLEAGTYDLYFYADPTCLTAEANENNNSYGPITVTINTYHSDTVGVFRPTNGALYLKNTNTTGYADVAINYGLGGDYPVVGDWDGNGTDTIGVYRNGIFLLRNSNTLGFADIIVSFGASGDQPIAGDWNGDGVDTIGVYRSSTGAFYLRNSNTSGPPDITFYLGNVGDVGISGDWNGDGVDTTGVFRPSNGIIFLKNANATGYADIALNYGLAGDHPVVGDWNGDGIDTIGIYRSARFYLRNYNTPGYANIILDLGNTGDMPIAGDWDNLP